MAPKRREYVQNRLSLPKTADELVRCLVEMGFPQSEFRKLAQLAKLHASEDLRTEELAPSQFFKFFDAEANRMPQNELKQLFQKWLYAQEGKSLNSLGKNKMFASKVTQRAKRLNLRFVCPGTKHSDCGLPATFSCKPSDGYETGAFYFYHQQRPHQHGISGQVPRLKLVEAAPDRRVKHA